MKKSKFIFGALVGAAIGMLFAPKKGSELRRDLSKKIDELVNKASEIDVDAVKVNFEKKLKELQENIQDLDKETVYAYAKKKASQLKDKADDLLAIAVKSGKPLVEDATKALKASLAEVTREVLKKLEDK